LIGDRKRRSSLGFVILSAALSGRMIQTNNKENEGGRGGGGGGDTDDNLRLDVYTCSFKLFLIPVVFGDGESTTLGRLQVDRKREREEKKRRPLKRVQTKEE